jgi:hypothetical protein
MCNVFVERAWKRVRRNVEAMHLSVKLLGRSTIVRATGFRVLGIRRKYPSNLYRV